MGGVLSPLKVRIEPFCSLDLRSHYNSSAPCLKLDDIVPHSFTRVSARKNYREGNSKMFFLAYYNRLANGVLSCHSLTNERLIRIGMRDASHSGRKETAMRNVLFFKTAACAEYEQLLRQCQQALIVLHERREQVRQDRLSGVEVGRELLTLQARYAKAYGALLKHSKNCDRCQFGSKLAKRKSAGTG